MIRVFLSFKLTEHNSINACIINKPFIPLITVTQIKVFSFFRILKDVGVGKGLNVYANLNNKKQKPADYLHRVVNLYGFKAKVEYL